jgi:hypothetical protein
VVDPLFARDGAASDTWWSNSLAYQRACGSTNLAVSLTDLSQWVSVFGGTANVSATATAGFKQAVANLGNVGFSFGGGCFVVETQGFRSSISQSNS